jgi:hypothetical protein
VDFWGSFFQGDDLNRVLKHTIELRLPRIDEWMGEPQGETYPSMIDLHLGYHQMRPGRQDTHRSASRLHYDFLVMPSGLTNALVISSLAGSGRGIYCCYLMPSWYTIGQGGSLEPVG